MNAIYIIYHKGDHLPYFISEDASEITEALVNLRLLDDYNKNDWVFEIKQTGTLENKKPTCTVDHKKKGMVGYHCEHRTY